MTSAPTRARLLGSALALAAAAGCGDVVGPGPLADPILVGGLSSGVVLAFSPDLGAAIDQASGVTTLAGPHDRSGASLYLRTTQGSTASLARIGLADLTHQSTPLADFTSAEAGAVAAASRVLVAIPGSGGLLAVDGVAAGGVEALHLIDPSSERIVATRRAAGLGPGGVAALTAGGGAELLALVAADSGAALLRLHGSSLALRDSVPLDLDISAAARPRELRVGSGSTVYFLTAIGLYAADRNTGEILAETQRLGESQIAVSPAAGLVVQTEPGDGFSSAGTGRLHVYGPSLSTVDVFETPTTFAGDPLRLTDVRIDAAERRLLAVAGTRNGPQLFPVQTVRIMALDLDDGALLASADLGVYGVPALLTGGRR